MSHDRFGANGEEKIFCPWQEPNPGRPTRSYLCLYSSIYGIYTCIFS